MKRLTVAVLAWTLWLDWRVIPLDAAPRGGLYRLPDDTPSKYESLEACETEIEKRLAEQAITQQWTATTVEGHYTFHERGKNIYIIRPLCLPDSFDPEHPEERTRVG